MSPRRWVVLTLALLLVVVGVAAYALAVLAFESLFDYDITTLLGSIRGSLA